MSIPNQDIDAAAKTSATAGPEYHAHTVGVADDDIDPLQAVLISTATDDQGLPVSVYLTLTPQVIVNLSAELHQILRAQRVALGFDPDATSGVLASPADEHHHHQDEDQEENEDQDDDAPRDALIRRAGDPAGLRYLRARARENPKVNSYIAAGVLALLVLLLVLKFIGR